MARCRGFLGDHAGKKAMLLRALELQRALFGRSYMEDLDYSRTLLFLASAHVMLGEVEDANRCVRHVAGSGNLQRSCTRVVRLRIVWRAEIEGPLWATPQRLGSVPVLDHI